MSGRRGGNIWGGVKPRAPEARRDPPMVEWVECPACRRTVTLVGGALGVHLVKRETARFPKMQQECRLSGRVPGGQGGLPMDAAP